MFYLHTLLELLLKDIDVSFVFEQSMILGNIISNSFLNVNDNFSIICSVSFSCSSCFVWKSSRKLGFGIPTLDKIPNSLRTECFILIYNNDNFLLQILEWKVDGYFMTKLLELDMIFSRPELLIERSSDSNCWLHYQDSNTYSKENF